MEIRKEMVWIFDENPKQDGDYLYAQFGIDGDLITILTTGYTKKYGWNSSMYSGGDHSWGQNPGGDGNYAWAKLPFDCLVRMERKNNGRNK